VTRVARLRHDRPVVANAAVLERQKSPPTPPRGGGGGGGGRGNNDGLPYFVRVLTPAEKAQTFKDWMARTKIYSMTGDFDEGNKKLGEEHSKQLQALERLYQFDSAGATLPLESNTTKLLYGGFDFAGKIIALAGIELCFERGFIASCLAMYPARVNEEDAASIPKIMFALRRFAKRMGMPLDLSQIEESGNEIG